MAGGEVGVRWWSVAGGEVAVCGVSTALLGQEVVGWVLAGRALSGCPVSLRSSAAPPEGPAPQAPHKGLGPVCSRWDEML